MTYGQVAQELRDSIGLLLAQQRVRPALDGRDARREAAGRLFALGYEWSEIQKALGLGRELMREYYAALRADGQLLERPKVTATDALKAAGFTVRSLAERRAAREAAIRDGVALLTERGYDQAQMADALGIDNTHTIGRYQKLLAEDGWTPAVTSARAALAAAGMEVPDRRVARRGAARSAAYRTLIGFLRERGHEQSEIAETLGLDVATVRTYQRRLEADGWAPRPQPPASVVLADAGLSAPSEPLREETRAVIEFLTRRRYTQDEIADALQTHRSNVSAHQEVLRSRGRLPGVVRPQMPASDALVELGYTTPLKVTPTERTETGALLMRYRAAVIDYLADLAELCASDTFASPAAADADAAYRLRRCLADLRSASGDRPTGTDLGLEQPIRVVELWRRAAVAAVTGRERELAVMSPTMAQRVAGVADVAEIMRAVLDLDERYTAARGWERLPQHTGHGAGQRDIPGTVLAAWSWARERSPIAADYAIDLQGSRASEPRMGPHPNTVTAAASALAAAAEHLAAEPEPVKAKVLRWIVVAQGRIAAYSRRLAVANGDDEHAVLSEHRYDAYRNIDAILTNVAGTAGVETLAAVEITDALHLIAHTRHALPGELAHLTHACRQIDLTVAKMMRRGVAGYYFQQSLDRGLDGLGAGVVRRAVPVYVPIDHETLPGYGAAWVELERSARREPLQHSAARESFDELMREHGAGRLARAQARTASVFPRGLADYPRHLADLAAAEMIAGKTELADLAAEFVVARARLVGALAASDGSLGELAEASGVAVDDVAALIHRRATSPVGHSHATDPGASLSASSAPAISVGPGM